MINPQDRVENEALLLCARLELAADEVARLRELITGNLDWDYVYKLARRHSLVPLVFSQLDAPVKEFVPPEVLQRFRKNYQENAARNLIFANELTSLLKALADVGVYAIVFKGPALAVSAYGDLALRRFVDLDVMVRRADVARAIEVISDNGYTSGRLLNAEQQELLVRTQHNLQFKRERLIVELHWQVSSDLFASSVTAEELWQNLKTVQLNKTEVKTLATEDLLFALCVHGSRPLWASLAWSCDLDRIIATGENIDWPRLMNRARKAKAERMFLLGPALAARLLGTRLPDAVTKAIANDRQIAAIGDEIYERLLDGTEQQPHRLGTIFHYNYRIRSDWRSRMRYCRHILAPTDSYLQSVRLSKPLHFVYYLLRPLRLLRN